MFHRILGHTVSRFTQRGMSSPLAFKNKESDENKENIHQGKVIANTDVTHDDQVHHVLLQVQNDSFTWKSGQAVQVVIDAPVHEAGKGKPDQEKEPPHIREYSIASPYVPKGPLAVLVRRFKDGEYLGKASNPLCDAKDGDSIQLKAPKNNALVLRDQGQKNMVAICSGTGIAPILSYLPIRKEIPASTVILYGVRDEQNFLMRKEIEDFAYHTPNAKALIAYSGEVTPEGLMEKKNPAKSQEKKSSLNNLPDVGYRKKAYIQDMVLERKENILNMLEDGNTYFLFCGGPNALKGLEKALTEICAETKGPSWETRKQSLIEQGRWNVESA